jgi:hypothetical protein
MTVIISVLLCCCCWYGDGGGGGVDEWCTKCRYFWNVILNLYFLTTSHASLRTTTFLAVRRLDCWVLSNCWTNDNRSTSHILFVFCVNSAALWSQTFITESLNVTPCIIGLLIKSCLSVDTNCKPRTLCFYSELRTYVLIRFKMRMTFSPTT